MSANLCRYLKYVDIYFTYIIVNNALSNSDMVVIEEKNIPKPLTFRNFMWLLTYVVAAHGTSVSLGSSQLSKYLTHSDFYIFQPPQVYKTKT